MRSVNKLWLLTKRNQVREASLFAHLTCRFLFSIFFSWSIPERACALWAFHGDMLCAWHPLMPTAGAGVFLKGDRVCN